MADFVESSLLRKSELEGGGYQVGSQADSVERRSIYLTEFSFYKIIFRLTKKNAHALATVIEAQRTSLWSG